MRRRIRLANKPIYTSGEKHIDEEDDVHARRELDGSNTHIRENVREDSSMSEPVRSSK